jgi:hypothetical protein
MENGKGRLGLGEPRVRSGARASFSRVGRAVTFARKYLVKQAQYLLRTAHGVLQSRRNTVCHA